MPLGLPILLGNRDEFIVEFGIDLRSELLCGWHITTSSSISILTL
jgi:hypothetical protein